jgi:hypothetical protein
VLCALQGQLAATCCKGGLVAVQQGLHLQQDTYNSRVNTQQQLALSTHAQMHNDPMSANGDLIALARIHAYLGGCEMVV